MSKTSRSQRAMHSKWVLILAPEMSDHATKYTHWCKRHNNNKEDCNDDAPSDERQIDLVKRAYVNSTLAVASKVPAGWKHHGER